MQNVTLPLSSGKWLSEAEQKEGYNNIIASYDMGLKVGDVIDCRLKQTNEDVQRIVDVQCIVVGVLAKSNYCLDFGSLNTPHTIDMLFKKAKKPMIVAQEGIGDIEVRYGKLFVFKDGLSPESVEQQYEYLQATSMYEILPIDTIIADTRYMSKEEAKVFWPITIVFSVLEVAALYTIAFVVLQKSQRIIAALRLSGYSKKDLSAIFRRYFGVIYGVAVTIYVMCSVVGLNPLTSGGTFVPDIATFVAVPLIYGALCLVAGPLLCVSYSPKVVDNF